MMDEIALIADIHGNLPALTAVAADLENRGITNIYCLGDICGRGPLGSLTLDWCRAHCQKIIMGNWEDFLLTRPELPMAKGYIRELGSERYEFLRTLPFSEKFFLSGRRLHLFHGRPLFPEAPNGEATQEAMLKMFTVLEDSCPADVVGYADIHRQYKSDFFGTGKVLFNTGSVGNSFCTNNACYVILRGTLHSRTPAPFSLEFVNLPYDIQAAIAHAKDAADWFDWENYAEMISTGTWRSLCYKDSGVT